MIYTPKPLMQMTNDELEREIDEQYRYGGCTCHPLSVLVRCPLCEALAEKAERIANGEMHPDPVYVSDTEMVDF